MATALAGCLDRIRSGVARAAIGQTVGWAHRSRTFRQWIIDQVADKLARSYEATERDPETLRLQKWFGRSLRPFLNRLIEERSRAAQALVRLA